MQNFSASSIIHTLLPSDLPKISIQPYNSPDHQDRKRKKHDFFQLHITIPLPSQSLVTHLAIQSTQEFWKIFQFSEVSYNSKQGIFQKLIHIKFSRKDDLTAIIEGVGLTSLLRISCFIHIKDFPQSRNFNQTVSCHLNSLLQSIKIHGYHMTVSPPASHLTPLLNISHLLRISSRQEQAVEADIILCMCLINGRRFIQAAEILRRASHYFVKKYQCVRKKQSLTLKNNSLTQMSKCNSSNIFFFNSSNYPNMSNNNSKKYLLRAAKIQLLIADAINHPSMIHQKVQAYYKVTSYFQGLTSFQDEAAASPNNDIYTALLKICPGLCKFLIKTLYDKHQSLKITAIKSLQFLIQTLGCSIGNYLPQLLKSILGTYPKTQSRLIQSYYHHLLQSFLTLLNSLSKQILRVMFQQVLLPFYMQSFCIPELMVYTVRIMQIIVQQCQGDLEIGASVFQQTIKLQQGRKGTSNNIVYFANRFIQVIKLKYLTVLDGIKLKKVVQWINQALLINSQHDISNIVLSSLQRLLDFITIILSRSRRIKFIPPLNPTLNYLNLALVQPRLPFQKLLQAIRLQLIYIKQVNSCDSVTNQIIQKIIQKSKSDSLSQSQLKILKVALQITDSVSISHLLMFVKCIPHSTFDQTFQIFDILVQKVKEKFQFGPVQKCINALLDQYTVKGKAHRNSKLKFIEVIMGNTQQLFALVFKFLVIDNKQPGLGNSSPPSRIQRLKKKSHDSKQTAKDHQLFLQKLNLSCQIAEKLTINHQSIIIQCLKDNSLLNILLSYVHSGNSKVRFKCLNFLKSIFQSWVATDLSKSQPCQILLKGRLMLSVLRPLLQSYRQSCLQFNSLVLLQQVFRTLFNPDNMTSLQTKNQKQADLQRLQYITFLTKNDFYQIRIKQLLKLLPLLISQISSPWHNIRTLILRFIANFFKHDAFKYRPIYFNKLIQLIKPLVTALLNSPDSSQRQGGLLICGGILGFTQKFRQKKQAFQLFRSRSLFLRDLYQIIYQLQNDWLASNQSLSSSIIQLSTTPDLKKSLRLGAQKGPQKVNNIGESVLSFNIDDLNSYNIIKQQQQSLIINNLSSNILQFLQSQVDQTEWHFNQNLDASFIEPSIQCSDYYFLQKKQMQQIQEILDGFRMSQQIPKSLWDERQHEHHQKQQKISQQIFWLEQEKNKQQGQLEDLGIIQVDDQDWNDYQQEVKITQKYPTKRKYKLSPNINSPNKSDYQRRQFRQQRKLVIDQVDMESSRKQNRSDLMLSNPTQEKQTIKQEQVDTCSLGQPNNLDLRLEEKRLVTLRQKNEKIKKKTRPKKKKHQ